MMKKINFTPVLLLNIAEFLLLSVSYIMEDTGREISKGFGIILFVLLVSSIVYTVILVYRCWNILPEEFRETTPGRAVGFLFIPVFNLYWSFVAYPGLARGYYRYGKSINSPEFKDISGLGNGYATLSVCCAIVPFISNITALNILLKLCSLSLFILFFSTIVNYANHVQQQNALPLLEAAEPQDAEDHSQDENKKELWGVILFLFGLSIYRLCSNDFRLLRRIISLFSD